MAVKWKWKPAAGGSVPSNLEQRIQAVETKASTNETNITNLQNDTVKLSGTQNISGVKVITATGEAIKFNSGSDTSAYMSGYKSGNQRVWYLGKSSSTDNHLRIGADRGNVKIEPSGDVDLSNKKIIALADPTVDQGAANKRYVDNRIKTRTLNQNIGVGTTFNIDPTSGYQIVSVMVARKRTTDSFYFFTHNINLNFQSFLRNNTQYAVYNNGTVNDFSNDFRIVITEMKV